MDLDRPRGSLNGCKKKKGSGESRCKILAVDRPAVTAAVFLALILNAADAAAVDPTNTLSLPNPGARSMALGGAFVAQADDATAAIANPAGLVQLLDPEFLAEARVWLFSSEEDFDNPDSEVSNLSAVGFMSAVYPIRRFSVAMYRNQLAKIDLNQDLVTLNSDLGSAEIVTWGLAGAYRMTENLSVGLGLAYNEGEAELRVDGETVRASGNEWSINAGLLWQPTAAFNFGGFFRQGADLDIAGTTPGVAGAATSALAVPDVYGLGVAFRTRGGSLALLAEWDHVRYSTVDGAEVGNAVVQFNDADELHVGAEYAFLRTSPIIAVRVGAWFDPAHRWLVEEGNRTRLGGDELHFSSGMGLAWKRFQFDFAFDVSDPVITMSVSGIFNF